MKKAIAILLVATLFLFLAGCGRNENIDDQYDEVSEEMPGDEETKDEGKMDAEIQSDPVGCEHFVHGFHLAVFGHCFNYPVQLIA